MDVKQSGFGSLPRFGKGLAAENLFESENAAVQKFNNMTSLMELLDFFESWLSKSEIPFDQEQFDKMRSFLEEMAKVTEQNKAAREQLERDMVQMKRRLVEGMLEIIRGLNAKLYTKESWRAAMRDVERGVSLYTGSKEPSRGQLDAVLRYLRSGIAKLEPAQSKTDKGKEFERESALSKLKKIGEGEADAKKMAAGSNDPKAGTFDVSIGGLDLAAGSVVVDVV